MRFIVTKTGDDGKNLRVDLQGLRGFGVLLVIIGHLWLFPRGAFGALDIFFVLSGFFISEILIDQYGKLNTLRFREFYLSRTRRLAPTALAAIAVSVVLAHVLYNSATAAEVEKQGFWAAVFGSNWYFIETGSNYFANLSDSPLVHYWSLSVEEQFYLVWPLLIWVALRTAFKRGWDVSRTMFVVFGVVTVVSFAYSLRHSAASPIAAYYSTFDRVWEFGIGGLLAAGKPWLTQIPARVGTILSWVMTIALGTSVFVLHYGQAFPAPWGLLPVLPCAGLIAAGMSGRVTGPFLITNAPMVYLGRISYSFYLWHLPVNFFLLAYFIEDTAVYKFVALGVGLFVSVLSFHLLERPMRQATWLMTRRERRRAQSKPPIDLRPVKLGWVAVLAVVASSLAVLSLVPASTPSDADVSASQTSAAFERPSSTPKSDQTPEQRQIARVAAGLRQSTFPAFDPSLDDLKDLSGDQDAVGCTSVAKQQAARCRFGSAGSTKNAVILGDSTAVAYSFGIREALVPEGWSVQQFTRLACPAWTLPASPTVTKGVPGCIEHNKEALELVRAQKPDLLILTTDAAGWLTQTRKVDLPLHDAELVDSTLSKTLEAMKPLAKRIVLLEAPPETRNLRTCVTRFSTPNDCKAFPGPDWNTGTKAERSTAERFGVEYISVRSWFCDGACPAFMGATPVMADGSHLSIQFSRSLGPVLRAALLKKADR